MNKNAIKNYAIWARNELITRVTQKAFEYGVSKENIVDFNAESVNGKLLTVEEKQQRQKLISEVKEKGFDQVMEEVAYTWFNRFIALRYMEVNNYLPNRVRVFTNENNEFKPQLLDEAATIELDGLDKEKVYQLLESNKNEELYKLLLLATCNDMHNYLPGMFETIDDYMSLLFPENLLRNESVLGRLIFEIDEDSWFDQVQIIGWLYQFYNTEPKALSQKKKKTTRDDIAAITQLFTPDWIVKYMVENSLGRIWLDGHEDDYLKEKWKYYINDEGQDESVKKKLLEIKLEHSKLKPEDIKILDPCMGSGHILVYAFDVLMKIYESQGWSSRDAAKSIVINNIFGIDIDNRAYQLAYFAIMMKARSYNRRILSEYLKPNVYVIEESNGFDMELLNKFGDLQPTAERVVHTFFDAKEYGSIIKVDFSKDELKLLEEKANEIDRMADYGSLLTQLHSMELIEKFVPLLDLAKIMSQKYEVVITNPPYMVPNDYQKSFITKLYPNSKSDFFAIFIEKCKEFTIKNGVFSLITMHNWSTASSYKDLRKVFLENYAFSNILHLGPHAFDTISGEIVQTISFVCRNSLLTNYKTIYVDLKKYSSEDKKEKAFLYNPSYKNISFSQYLTCPEYKFLFSLNDKIIKSFENNKSLKELITPKQGTSTGDDDKYIRNWFEVEWKKIKFDSNNVSDAISSGYKYFPIDKGGQYRKWYGNNEKVIKFNKESYEELLQMGNHLPSRNLYFHEGLTWSKLSSELSVRYDNNGFVFSSVGLKGFPLHNKYMYLAFMNSNTCKTIIKSLAQGFTIVSGDIEKIPFINPKIDDKKTIETLAIENIEISKNDWDSFEISWDYKKHPLVCGLNSIKDSFSQWEKISENRFITLKNNEEEINKIFIRTYGLDNELDSKVDDNAISIRRANLNREIKSFISYSVGCMFGRYSLNRDGIAFAGGLWDESIYITFKPDEDNIIPICDDEYFTVDIVGRFVDFVRVVYGTESLEENLEFISKVLGGKGTPREVLRNYFLNDFFKDHCDIYQSTGSGKKPIYWLFDSGKKNGFKALIYIHRYTPDLIARMRTQYIHEQQARYRNQIELLERQIDDGISTSEHIRLNKQLKKFKEQDEELRKYEEKIHHWADRMEPMDLDDGVKVNYAKFQEVLAKIK